MYDLLDMTCLPVDIILEMDGSFPITGDTIFRLKRIEWEPGGSGNIFILFTRLGGTVLPFAPIGRDPYGRFLVRTFQKFGIETKYLIETENYETQASHCLIDNTGAHTFLSKFPSAVFAPDINLDEIIEQCKSFYLSGYSMAGSKDLPMVQRGMELIRRFRQAGKMIFFDPGPRVKAIDEEFLKEILQSSDMICYNAEEATLQTGYESVEGAATELARVCPNIVIVKDGSNGCYSIDHRQNGEWYPGFKVKKVDTMAAGDCFMSCVMYGLLHGWDLRTCLVLGNAAGAAKTAKFGTGTNVPTTQEIYKLLIDCGILIKENQFQNGHFVNLKIEGVG